MKLFIVTGCDDCPVGRYITQMYEGNPQLHPACCFPTDEEDAEPVQLGGADDDLPEGILFGCPLLDGELLIRADKSKVEQPDDGGDDAG